MTIREELYQLIDNLPEDKLQVVKTLLVLASKEYPKPLEVQTNQIHVVMAFDFPNFSL